MGNSESSAQHPQSTPNFSPTFEVEKKITSPHYGEVKIVKETKTGEDMILKDVVVNTKEAYEKELDFYNKRVTVSHPNIVRIFGYTSQDKQNFCSTYYKISIFIEVLSRDLETVLKERTESKTPLTENELLVIADNLVSGLSDFQTQQLSHGDIRPFNIFVTAENTYKLSDPYLHPQRTNALATAILGHGKTLLAPELVGQVPTQDFEIKADRFKSDVFSLGATLLSLATLTNSEDFEDLENGKILVELINERLEVVRTTYSNFVYELIRDMLTIDPETRPDFVALSNRLSPYSEAIRSGASITVEEKKPEEVVGETSEVTGTDDALRKASEQLAKSQQLTGTEYTYTPVNYTPINYSTEDLDARIKAALERSQATFKQIFGTDGASTYNYTSTSNTTYTPTTYGTTGTSDVTSYKVGDYGVTGTTGTAGTDMTGFNYTPSNTYTSTYGTTGMAGTTGTSDVTSYKVGDYGVTGTTGTTDTTGFNYTPSNTYTSTTYGTTGMGNAGTTDMTGMNTYNATYGSYDTSKYTTTTTTTTYNTTVDTKITTDTYGNFGLLPQTGTEGTTGFGESHLLTNEPQVTEHKVVVDETRTVNETKPIEVTVGDVTVSAEPRNEGGFNFTANVENVETKAE